MIEHFIKICFVTPLLDKLAHQSAYETQIAGNLKRVHE